MYRARAVCTSYTVKTISCCLSNSVKLDQIFCRNIAQRFLNSSHSSDAGFFIRRMLSTIRIVRNISMYSSSVGVSTSSPTPPPLLRLSATLTRLPVDWLLSTSATQLVTATHKVNNVQGSYVLAHRIHTLCMYKTITTYIHMY